MVYIYSSIFCQKFSSHLCVFFLLRRMYETIISRVLPKWFTWSLYNLKSDSLFCDAFCPLLFTCACAGDYCMTLVLVELTSQSSISLIFRSCNCMCKSSLKSAPISSLNTWALLTQLSPTSHTALLHRLFWPSSHNIWSSHIFLFVSLKTKFVCMLFNLLCCVLFPGEERSRFWANLLCLFQKFCQNSRKSLVWDLCHKSPLYIIVKT